MIYFIQDEIDKSIKIGYTSNNVDKRLSAIQISNPRRIILLCIEDGDVFKEKELHKLFSEYKIHGEWFTPGERLLEYISHLKYIGKYTGSLLLEKHPCWKGSEATKSSKKGRAKRRYKINQQKCNLCDKLAKDIFYKDGNYDNINKENIIFLCRSCRMYQDGSINKLIEAARNNAIKKFAPPKPCANCEKPYKPLRNGRCHSCDIYYRNNNIERPSYLYKEFKQCINCCKSLKVYHSHGRCGTCSVFFNKHGFERPEKLINKNRNCQVCQKPSNPLRKNKCRTCYFYFKKHNQDRNEALIIKANERNKNPEHCINCKRKNYKSCKGRCNTCYEYLKRNGKERPVI